MLGFRHHDRQPLRRAVAEQVDPKQAELLLTPAPANHCGALPPGGVKDAGNGMPLCGSMSGGCFTEPWRDARDSCRMRGGARSCPAGRTRTARPD